MTTREYYTGPRRGSVTDADYDEDWCRECRSSPCRCPDLEDEARDDELMGVDCEVDDGDE